MSKKIKKERFDYFNNNVLHELEDLFDVSIIAPKHYRIVSRVNNRIADYYPQSKKMFLLNEQKWGVVSFIEVVNKLKKYLKV